jgi:Tol biopolymer transport system component
MKRRYIVLTAVVILLITWLFLTACEPVSVSVNDNSEVAFTRLEGVFFINVAKESLSTVFWNHKNKPLPVITRWSPDGKQLAFTERKDKDSTDTSVYVVNRDGSKKRKMYSTSSKVITQLEWSPDGAYISLAQNGEDSDMGVADLALISTRDGMSKTIVANSGDVHSWLDNNRLIFMKIREKNPDNGDIMKGALAVYDITSGEWQRITSTIVGKVGSIDCDPDKKTTIFSAIKAGSAADSGYEENMSSDSYAYMIKDGGTPELINEAPINFLLFSPDGSTVLAKMEKDYKKNLVTINLTSKAVDTLIVDVTDKISANSSDVQVYPAWLDGDTVLFWRFANTYGYNGQALQLMSIETGNRKISNLQPFIDRAIDKLVMQKGGY